MELKRLGTENDVRISIGEGTMNKNIKLAGFITLLIVASIISYNFNNPHREIKEFECWNDTKLLTMWNNETATSLGITQEDLINISYSYLYDYEIRCPKHLQDCFIEAPAEWCCYETNNNLYCRSQFKDTLVLEKEQ